MEKLTSNRRLAILVLVDLLFVATQIGWFIDSFRDNSTGAISLVLLAIALFLIVCIFWLVLTMREHLGLRILNATLLGLYLLLIIVTIARME